jgi:CheY-like chemotaxis protein
LRANRSVRHQPGGSGARETPARTRILLVEDHLDTALVMRLLLEKAGYQVVLADSVAKALAAVDDTIALLLSDIALPDGSGLDVMRRVLLAHRSVTGIALSGYGSPEDLGRSRAAGFARHLVKPFEVPDLLRVIEELLPGRRPRGGMSNPSRRRH